MKNLNYLAPKVPTANLAVNKSRVKLYNKQGDLPTYYLQKGQEFQIELFNPTTDTVLAKITLNGNVISQGGLVLNPGQRIFLDRYLDVAKKFLFDTYEVSNTQEVKEAIVNNGDFKVEFYREIKPIKRNPLIALGTSRTTWGGPNYHDGILCSNSITGGYVSNSTGTNVPSPNTFTTSTNAFTSTNVSTSPTGLKLTRGVTNTATVPIDTLYSSNIDFVHDGSATMDWMQTEKSIDLSAPRTRSFAKKSKSIETGRVEQGSDSDQKFKTVNKDFEWFSFHTIEAKLLPISQKVNTAEDINVKRYCTNCGSKLAKGDKFCSKCGTKA